MSEDLNIKSENHYPKRVEMQAKNFFFSKQKSKKLGEGHKVFR